MHGNYAFILLNVALRNWKPTEIHGTGMIYGVVLRGRGRKGVQDGSMEPSQYISADLFLASIQLRLRTYRK